MDSIWASSRGTASPVPGQRSRRMWQPRIVNEAMFIVDTPSRNERRNGPQKEGGRGFGWQDQEYLLMYVRTSVRCFSLATSSCTIRPFHSSRRRLTNKSYAYRALQSSSSESPKVQGDPIHWAIAQPNTEYRIPTPNRGASRTTSFITLKYRRRLANV